MTQYMNETSLSGSDSMAHIGKVRIITIKGDITEENVNVIVNSANTQMLLRGTKSVAGAIIEKKG